ncbi:tRNA (cytidine(34)-2'-O)-methyltransferase [Qipengyuania sphaerica]|uniref:tRNA (cytidine(34)-2'-O)-methyltransferase n=1 Tax=Qipengyuania sphaerica TaxID=2867243 RepID=UPI001C87405F|nr:tRNA (cytidine(34)-2'-O)-methyltransferase [Qipengyuania sphaerica]MBX7540954.1 tRNA (cytidine(34)-2'-O)-methyltransferase [Qipengyuania sphaerica]
MRIALFEPEIAGNVGAVMRTAACMGAGVDLIEPMGFRWDDRRVRRAAMDYIDHVEVVRHDGFEAFRKARTGSRIVLFTTRATQCSYDFDYRDDDILLFGKESAGVTDAVRASVDASVKLPMRPEVRSLNLATSAAIALTEALRQTGTLPR